MARLLRDAGRWDVVVWMRLLPDKLTETEGVCRREGFATISVPIGRPEAARVSATPCTRLRRWLARRGVRAPVRSLLSQLRTKYELAVLRALLRLVRGKVALHFRQAPRRKERASAAAAVRSKLARLRDLPRTVRRTAHSVLAHIATRCRPPVRTILNVALSVLIPLLRRLPVPTALLPWCAALPHLAMLQYLRLQGPAGHQRALGIFDHYRRQMRDGARLVRRLDPQLIVIAEDTLYDYASLVVEGRRMGDRIPLAGPRVNADHARPYLHIS